MAVGWKLMLLCDSLNGDKTPFPVQATLYFLKMHGRGGGGMIKVED